MRYDPWCEPRWWQPSEAHPDAEHEVALCPESDWHAEADYWAGRAGRGEEVHDHLAQYSKDRPARWRRVPQGLPEHPRLAYERAAAAYDTAAAAYDQAAARAGETYSYLAQRCRAAASVCRYRAEVWQDRLWRGEHTVDLGGVL